MTIQHDSRSPATVEAQLEEIQDSAVLSGMVSDLMDGMNGVTRNFKTVFNQSTAQKEANKKPEEGEGGEGEGGLEFVPVEK